MSIVTRIVLLAIAFLLAPAAIAQFPAPEAPCPEGTGEAILKGVNVEAALYTNGNLFFGNSRTNGDGYLVPTRGEDAGSSPIFTGNIWIGGRVGGEIRSAGARYNRFKLRPGLTGSDLAPPDSSACASADRITILSRLDSDAEQLAAARNWPVALGAPVIDGDGIEGNYDLASGDRPAIRGDAMAFWAMTDTATERVPLGDDPVELPLGVDVTVEAFTFLQLETMTFYRFTVTNRNAVPIEDAAIGLFLDYDLGSASDDYIATDTTLHMSYVYNSGEDDFVYGVPPASGAVVVRGPLADANGRDDDRDGETDEPGERMGLTSSAHIPKSGGYPYLEPIAGESYYQRLLGYWSDGTSMREGGEGIAGRGGTGQPTVFVYPGDPVEGTFWSEENVDAEGQRSASGDRRGLASTGPVRLEPGESMDVTFALVFGQGTDRLDSVRKLRGQAEIALRIQDALGLSAFDLNLGTMPPPPPLALQLPRPNPFRDTATLRLSGASGANARVSVYDVLGRRVSSSVVPDAPEAEVQIGAGLPSGLYIVRVEGLAFEETFTVVKAE